MRVLLVEQNARLAAALNADLGKQAVTVEIATDGGDALHLLQVFEFDLAMVGSSQSGADASNLVSRIRDAKHQLPIIALSSLPQARLKALAAGADDVVERDIDRAELCARIRAVVRRSRGFAQPRIQVGGLQLDIDRCDVIANDVRVTLTGKEFAILQLLMLRRNMVLTKEAILEHLYSGRDEPEIKIVDVFICKLRSKLRKAGLPEVISTVWGRGYTVRDVGPHEPAAPSRPARVRAELAYA